MNIGEMMQAASAMKGGIDNPVTQLRKLIDGMKSGLSYYEKMNPEANTTKRRELIMRLELICQTLEQSGPLDVWNVIWEKLGEARREKFNADTALVYFPLKTILPRYNESKQVVIDLCGYNLEPYAYDYCRGKFFTSWLNEEEGRA